MTTRINPIVPRLKWDVLSPAELERIHEATLEIMEEVGIRFPSEKVLGILEQLVPGLVERQQIGRAAGIVRELRALESGTAGLSVPTGEVVEFPTNTSDALMSGGADAIAGAVERMYRRLQKRTGQVPALIMSGGAAVKLASITDLPVETVETLIFDGLLHLQAKRLAL